MKIIEPYTFNMGQEEWDLVAKTNAVEYNLALQFCLEHDMNFFTDEVVVRPSFHTMMYVEFNRYVHKNAIKDAANAVATFESKTLAKIPPVTFKAGRDGLKVMAEQSMSAASTLLAVMDLKNNGGPIVINETMYRKMFKKQYDRETIEVMKAWDVQ